jgi:predicted SAM-dependent methyltransferase
MPPQRWVRVNVGCGPFPTPGWVNVDNSPSVVLARLPAALSSALAGVGILKPQHLQAIDVARRERIVRASATRLPLDTGSVDVVYSCHMLEHLDRSEARQFLSESRRVIRRGGRLRLVVPDLDFHVESYKRSGDADGFFEELMVTRSPSQGLQKVADSLVGFRGHRWMYDGASLKKLVEEAGFEDVEILEPGETRISDPGPLDLREREEGSIYLEGRRPE